MGKFAHATDQPVYLSGPGSRAAGLALVDGAPALFIGHKSLTCAQIAPNRPEMTGIAKVSPSRPRAPVSA